MRVDPYAHAPRLPDGEDIDPGLLFAPTAQGAAPVSARVAPVELEIGPGRGWFTVERLEFDPDVRVLGLEIRRKWATIVDQRLTKRGLAARGRVLAEDAKAVLPRLLSRSVSVAYLHFPDPWWKKRHHKRLVLGDPLLSSLARVVVPGGELFIQTDVAERAEEYAEVVARSAAFSPFGDSPWIDDHPYGARSPRERKAMDDGLPVRRLRFRRSLTEAQEP